MSPERLRIAMLVVTLEMGGATRVTTTLANHWASHGADVCVISYEGPTKKPAFDLHPLVAYQPLDLERVSRSPLQGIANNLLRVLAVRRVVREFAPHVVIGHQDREGVVAILATRGLEIPVVAREPTHPTPNDIGAGWSRLRAWTFPHADAIVVPTARAAAFFTGRAGRRTVVLPNPIRPLADEMRTPPEVVLRHPSIVALGTLREIKDYPVLIRAFARVAPRFPTWSLAIVGEGPDRPELTSLVRDLGLDGRVRLPGSVSRPAAVLAQADLYALSSYREGFTNSLIEALASGVPAVSTDCPSGPGDIIRHGVDGLLVPVGDIDAFASALAFLMGDEQARRRMSEEARRVIERFGVDVVASRWEDLIDRLRTARGLRTISRSTRDAHGC